MSAEIIQLASKESVDKAWDEYVALACQIPDNPKLLTDPEFFGRLKRAERRWTQLFLILEAA